MVNHYATMAGVPSQHLHPTHAFRPEPGEWDPAEAILTARGVKPGAFLRACLRWLASDPDAAFAALARHWPRDRPRGRPRGRRPQPDPGGKPSPE
jgi:hypothetical protein